MTKKKAHKTTKNTKPNTDWKDFERMVTRLEKAMAPQGAIVKWNDKIPDKTTGELRQVDASIRYKIGLTEILIIIECRKRSVKADSTWFEQLNSKRSEIGADKVIVVTSQKLTQPAYLKAKRFNIDVRRVNEITASSIFTIIKVTHIQSHFSVHGANVSVLAEIALQEQIQEHINTIKYDDKMLIPFNKTSPNISPIELIEYLLHTDNTTKLIDSMPLAKFGESEKVRLMHEVPADNYYIETPIGNFTVYMMTIIFTRNNKVVDTLPKRMFSYHDELKKLTETVEFDFFNIDGKKNTLSLHKAIDKPNLIIQVTEE